MVKSVMFMKDRNRRKAIAPVSAAPSLRHQVSGFGLEYAPDSSGSGSGSLRSGSYGTGGSVPPQASMTSSAVTASGSRPRAMRLAEVV